MLFLLFPLHWNALRCLTHCGSWQSYRASNSTKECRLWACGGLWHVVLRPPASPKVEAWVGKTLGLINISSQQNLALETLIWLAQMVLKTCCPLPTAYVFLSGQRIAFDKQSILLGHLKKCCDCQEFWYQTQVGPILCLLLLLLHATATALHYMLQAPPTLCWCSLKSTGMTGDVNCQYWNLWQQTAHNKWYCACLVNMLLPKQKV